VSGRDAKDVDQWDLALGLPTTYLSAADGSVAHDGVVELLVAGGDLPVHVRGRAASAQHDQSQGVGSKTVQRIKAELADQADASSGRISTADPDVRSPLDSVEKL
jgi:hypothetical protein